MARQLGLDTARLAGTGPGGAATLTDVLREAGREPPAAARPPPPRTIARTGEEAGAGSRRMEVTCDAKPIRAARDAFAGLAAEPPEALDIVVRLCGAALRDFPGLAGAVDADGGASHSDSIDVLVAGPAHAALVRGADGAGIGTIREAVRAGRAQPQAATGDPATAFVVRTPDGPDIRPADAAGGTRGGGGAVLTFVERGGSILLALEFGAGTGCAQDGAAFLDRLRALCLDPRRALL